jgi:hypothetical protein
MLSAGRKASESAPQGNRAAGAGGIFPPEMPAHAVLSLLAQFFTFIAHN